MRQVLSKWRGHGNTERHFPDFDIDAKFTEDRVDARIEVPDRHSGAEPERLGPAVSGPHDQGMIDEVDGDIERCAAMVEAACRQAADVYVQRDVPPVVARCLVASRILPRIWLYRCSVSFVARQSARCSSGRVMVW
jgi:hypothetical protein